MKNWKIILAILTANVVFMSASYTMLIPFLPMYLVRELGVSQSEVTMWSGVVFSVTFLIGGIMAPVWGKMADTHGKKPMAIRSGLGLALSYLLGGMVTSPEQMVGVRVLQGFAAGLWSVCLAIATSSVPVGKLGMSLGILQSGLTAGNVIGPLIGGVLASMFGMRTSFYLGGAVYDNAGVLVLYSRTAGQQGFKRGSCQRICNGAVKKCAYPRSAYLLRHCADGNTFNSADNQPVCGKTLPRHG